MDELIRTFNKKRKLKKTLSTAAIVAGILVEIISFILFIIFVVQGDNLANIFGVLFLVLPVLALIAFFVSAFKKDKLETQLYDALEKGNFSAEEILLIGEKINVNLFSNSFISNINDRNDFLPINEEPQELNIKEAIDIYHINSFKGFSKYTK